MIPRGALDPSLGIGCCQGFEKSDLV